MKMLISQLCWGEWMVMAKRGGGNTNEVVRIEKTIQMKKY